MEVLLVLALMALVSMVLLPAASALFPKTGTGNIDDTIAEVLQQVRREAVTSGTELALRYDGATQRLAWGKATSPALVPDGQKLALEFIRQGGGGSSVLIGGQLVETTTVPVMRFFPDGTCDAVRVQLRVGRATRRLLAIDPWTCAPGLEVKS